ncbi:MAG: cbb3-type cytochrome c oxidase subunit 3 [Pseudomonadota bacterium]
MDSYSWLRQFADSWVLLAMFLMFAGVVLWTLRPGSKPKHDDIANIPFRNEREPGGE